jgi:NADH-quinone oxidoreductase subunit L
MIQYAWLIPALPLAGTLIAALGARILKEKSHLPVAAGIGCSFIVSLLLLFSTAPASHEGGAVQKAAVETEKAEKAIASHPVTDAAAEKAVEDAPLAVTTVVYHWFDAGDLHVPVEFRADGLTTMMICMVTFVAFFVTIFAAGYMAGDPGYPRFFAFVGLFVFSMTGLVLSNNYVLTYGFWEGVGTCSYLLVGFWYAKPSAAAAAKKAFLVNRLGDAGFAIALFWLWTVVPGHDLSYTNVLSAGTINAIPYDARLGISLLLFWAATAKSAQLPLYVWLPDAMEGPTPVSALIHAATMVTAGVYLIARSSVLVMSVPVVPLIIAAVGCATALLAALIALTQNDLKRVMAYSTVSQLGYMFMALGAGTGSVMRMAVVAAMFHLFTHAFFKALLFLASGSVMHSMGGVIDMRRFGGLRHRMPITCWTFAVGGLALAGIFPFAGFWSKDEILAALALASRTAAETGQPAWTDTAYTLIYGLAIFTAFLTAFYTGRAFFLTFFGPEKLPSPDDPEAEPVDPHGSHADDHGHGHGELGHESPPVMTVPLIILAACALLVGLIYGPLTGWFHHHIIEGTPMFEPLQAAASHGLDWASMGIGTVAALAGLAISWMWYGTRSPSPGHFARAAGPLYRASLHKFGVDEIYTALVIKPTWILATISKFFDIYVIDGLVRLFAWLPRFVGREILSPFQNGLVQFYAAVTALSVACLLLILLLT